MLVGRKHPCGFSVMPGVNPVTVGCNWTVRAKTIPGAYIAKRFRKWSAAFNLYAVLEIWAGRGLGRGAAPSPAYQTYEGVWILTSLSVQLFSIDLCPGLCTIKTWIWFGYRHWQGNWSIRHEVTFCNAILLQNSLQADHKFKPSPSLGLFWIRTM